MTAPLELFTLKEVAQKFRVSERTLREFLKEYPFYRKLRGRRLFTHSDINQLYEALNCPSNSRSAATPGTSTAPSAASVSARLRALLTERRQKRSASSAKAKSSNVVSMAQPPAPPSKKPR